MKKTERVIITLIVVVFSMLIYNLFYENKPIEREKAVATNIVDGDTIVISGGDRVRLLGIDTPEKGEFYYSEAKKRLEALIENKEILLEKEGDDKDQYDRLLRYVFLNDSNVNMAMVQEGYAICYFYQESRYKETCKSLEENAMQNKIGRWQNQSK
jgi:micrococcal nuclease